MKIPCNNHSSNQVTLTLKQMISDQLLINGNYQETLTCMTQL